MISVKLICVGPLKEAYLKEAVTEYEKRISAYARLQTIVLREEKIANENNPSEIEAALSAEAAHILSVIPPDAYRTALCVEGKELTSPELAATLDEGTKRCGKLALVIGSSHGLHPSVKAACDLRLSLSRLTLPHQLARVFLLETLYRSFTILAGKIYHK